MDSKGPASPLLTCSPFSDHLQYLLFSSWFKDILQAVNLI